MSEEQDKQTAPAPSITEHAGFALRQRVWVDSRGWEFVNIVQKKGIPPSNWFNCADLVIEDVTNPPENPMTMEGRRPAAFVKFQDGPIKEVGINGVQVEQLIDLSWQRLLVLGSGNGGMDEETSKAVENLKSAARWLEARKQRRSKAGTEGTARMLVDDAPQTAPADGGDNKMDAGGYEDPVTESYDQGGYTEPNSDSP